MFETKFIPALIFLSVAYVLLQLFQAAPDTNSFYYFAVYVIFTVISYFATDLMIPVIKPLNLKADLFGMDINKKGTPAGQIKIPESLGIVPATIYLIFNILGILFTKYYLPGQLLAHISALLSVTFIVFLGFADDVLDLAWRYKLILPPIASLPVIVAYTGVTDIVLPKFLRGYMGNTMNLGPLYYLYMTMLATFNTNAINIYAGINGIEVGQSLIIGCAIIIHNTIEIGSSSSSSEYHFFSLLVVIPYLFTALALYKHNHYPSKVFVGDIFCYWSGMTFAVAGILGHFSKTLMLFCIPQIINFLYSIPQLFGIIFCPRHRLPKYNQETQLLEPIKTNLTLINLTLLIIGPTSEKNLCRILLVFQIICCIFGLGLRYLGASLLF